MSRQVHLTGVEKTFSPSEIIVSKTDRTGRIIYANEVFCRIASYSEAELIGKPHSIIRHPAMPRCVFKLLWDTIFQGEECFAYVLNRSKEGDHYWVLAHITPTFDDNGKIISFHSSRRSPRRDAIDKATALYAELLAIEKQDNSSDAGMNRAFSALVDKLKSLGLTYDEFVFSL